MIILKSFTSRILTKKVYRLIWTITIIMALFSQSALAITQDDEYCAAQGGVSGTCFYSPDGQSTSCSTTGTETVPAGTLPSFIPEPYNGAITEGANNNKVAPSLVAAIFSEEHDLGGSETNVNTSGLPAAWASFVKGHADPNSGWASSTAGAQGPFQFEPATFTGLGYNISKINDLVTAADAAAKYLASNGGTVGAPLANLQDAVSHYNPGAPWYIVSVINMYNYYNSQPGSTPGSPTTLTTESSDSDCSTTGGSTACNGSSATTSAALSPTRQQVLCIAEQELATWEAQPGYPWNGPNSYSATGFLKYSENRSEEWCADFVSWVYNQAGDPISGSSSDWNYFNVGDIQTTAESSSKFQWHPESSGYTPQPGDIAIHGGAHTNIYISSQGDTTTYIGGDQGVGPYPGGSIVSIENGVGYYDNGITGYVSPD